MNMDDKLPVGIYVKVKDTLKIDRGDKYGISVVSDMLKYRGYIFIVKSQKEQNANSARHIALMDPITNIINYWTWTPVMLEIASNEDIERIRSIICKE